MGLERDKWLAEFQPTGPLPWKCPACNKSLLCVVPGSLKDGETSASRSRQDDVGTEPETIDGRFACMMHCAYCRNEVGVTGRYRYCMIEEPHYENESDDYEKYYRPNYFTESPHLVEIPEATPETVVNELLASFQLFWCDALGCTNRIRSAVEKLLTKEHVPQTVLAKGKRVRLTLHNRIELYQKTQKEVAERLMAAKWIGNAGSHGKGVTIGDALDTYELIDWVLETLYARRHKRAAALSRAINKRRGPLSPRRGV